MGMPRRLLLLAAAVALFSPASGWAASITIDEAGMDAIYGQASFGAAPVNIRFNAPITHVDPNLLMIDSATKVTAALTLFGPGPTVFMIFVDDISFCGGTADPAFVGCASLPGNHMIVESGIMALPGVGAVLGSHELGHNAGLGHVGLASNLMLASISATTTVLTSAQATIILASAIEQFDTEAFISITPVLMVPEPGSLVLLLLAAAGVGIVRMGRGR